VSLSTHHNTDRIILLTVDTVSYSYAKRCNGLQYLYPDTKLSREDLGIYFFNNKGSIIDYNNEDDWVDFTNFRNIKENLYESGKILTNYIYHKENEQ
jgi:hypothetical protein